MKLPENMKRVVWTYKADRMTATELEHLIAGLQVREQDGDDVTFALFHLTKLYEMQFEQK